MASNNQLEDQYDGPRANLSINKVDPREAKWHVGTYWRDQFRFRVMLKDKGWFYIEKAKHSFCKFLTETGGDEGLEADWFTTTSAGEDGWDGHSIYCKSISFMVMARMMDNIELEEFIEQVQERTDVEYEDDIPPLVLIPDDERGPIMDLSTQAPTLDSAFRAEQNQKTSRPLKVFTPVPVILLKSFGAELPVGTSVEVMLTVHGELYLLKDGCFCDDAKEGVDFTFIGSKNNTFGS